MKKTLLACLIVSSLLSCEPPRTQEDLPILGARREVDGQTVYHTIPDFTMVNQYGETVRKADVVGKKIIVSDFFFTSCSTICPRMNRNMLKLVEEFADDDRVLLLSHTIDPAYDTPEVLKEHADRLGLTGNTWQFLTGTPQEEVFTFAQNGYFAIANVDETETVDKGLIHTGAFFLVDYEGRIRGKYDGADEMGIPIPQLIEDIKLLLANE